MLNGTGAYAVVSHAESVAQDFDRNEAQLLCDECKVYCATIRKVCKGGKLPETVREDVQLFEE